MIYLKAVFWLLVVKCRKLFNLTTAFYSNGRKIELVFEQEFTDCRVYFTDMARVRCISDSTFKALLMAFVINDNIQSDEELAQYLQG